MGMCPHVYVCGVCVAVNVAKVWKANAKVGDTDQLAFLGWCHLKGGSQTWSFRHNSLVTHNTHSLTCMSTCVLCCAYTLQHTQQGHLAPHTPCSVLLQFSLFPISSIQNVPSNIWTSNNAHLHIAMYTD